MKFVSFLEFWLHSKMKSRIKLKTYWVYYGLINKHINPYFGNYEIEELNSKVINEFIDSLREKNLSKSSISITISIIKTSIKNYYGEDINRLNLCFDKYVTPYQKKQESFSINEQKKIESYILKTQSINLYGILICMLTGIRIGELLALDWNDIDFNNKFINVDKTLYEGKDYNGQFKTIIQYPKSQCSVRKIPITKKLIDFLKEMKRKAKTTYVIESRGKRQSLRSYQNKFRRLLTKIKVNYKSFHCLRHTFATRAVESGIDIKTLSVVLGHSSIKITLDRYTTISNDFKMKEMCKVENYLNKKCSSNNLLDEPLHYLL